MRRFFLVVGVVGAASALRWALDPLFGAGKQFLVFFPAVAVAALVGGARAGVVATVLSALVTDLWFIEPRGGLIPVRLSDWVALGLFVVAGGLISWMAERMERARRREWQSLERERAAEEVRRSEKQLEEARRESEEHLRRIGDNLPDTAVYRYAYESDGTPRFLYISAGVEQINGLKVEDVLRDAGTLLGQIPPDYREQVVQARKRSARELSDFAMEVPMRRPDGEVRWVRLRSRPRRMPDGRVIWDGVEADITARKQAEANQALLTDVLHILNRGGELHAVMREALGVIRERAGFDAVGLRLRQGEDCPYYAHEGFSPEFVREENFLCAKGPAAAVVRDAEGRPVLECTCGLVLSGRIDPRMTCFTRGGSFWTNVSKELLALAPQDDPRKAPRNRCIHTGYQSVGLFPVRAGREIVGLLQLNDRREGRFTPESLAFYENLAQNIGLAFQRAAAEAAARAVSAELQRTSNIAATGLIRCSRDLRYRSANPAYARLVGLPVEQIVGRPIVEVVGERAFEIIRPYVERVLRGERVEYETELPYAAAGPRCVHVALTADEDSDGKVAGFVASVTDVTEWKRAEEKLRESEERLRLANKATNDVIWDWDMVNDRQRWNEAGAVVFGWTEIVEHSVSAAWWAERVHPEDRQRVEEGFFTVVNNPEATYWHDEYRFLKADGSYAEVMDRGYVLRDKAGKAVRMIGAMLDMTERKRAEEARARLAAVVEWSDDAIISKALDGTIQTWNAGAERMFGYRAEEVIGRPVRLLIPPERLAEEERVLAQLRRGEPVKHYETVRLTKDGQRLDVSLTISPVKDSGGRIIGASKIVRDIGALVRAREVLARDKQELERLVAERTAKLEELVGELEHFSYTITHDMRAPLRGMQGFAEVMAEACQGCERQDALGFMRRIRTSAGRMDALITDALNYSRAVRQELTLAPVDAGALLRGMVDSYPELQRSRARIEIEGEIPLVMGNEAGLTQCFSNLLGNAVKFVKPGQKPEIRIRAEEVRSAAGPGEWVRIWVEDKGIGIPEAMRGRVFDMFSRGSKEYEGTGIGLALVRKVVDRMDGRVGVESEEGKGSRFWIELKLGEMRAKPRRVEVAPVEPKGEDGLNAGG